MQCSGQSLTPPHAVLRPLTFSRWAIFGLAAILPAHAQIVAYKAIPATPDAVSGACAW